MRNFASLAFLAPLVTATLPAQTHNFESPQITPIAISADGTRMLAANTPDNRVALFSLANPLRPLLLDEIEVGLEPVSIAFRNAHEAWVVNHLSDSISIVDLDAGLVVDTLQVEDEPSAIVFAGTDRAFVTTATRRLVQVFDTNTRGLIGSIPLFADQPRWAVASADGSRVFVGSHRSGNDTTVVPEHLAPPQPPPTTPGLPSPPSVGLIVDSDDPAWTSAHGVDLPDYDVFEIDTNTLAVTRRVTGVGTVLFGMDVHPTTGDLWVANTEARNLVRFEPTLRGHIVDHRVTRVPSGVGTVQAFDLNPGVDYSMLPNAQALTNAVAQPTDVVFSPNGIELFVAGFGSDRVAVLDGNGTVLARIDIGDATSARQKRGPRGLAHHPTLGVLYVVNRLSNTLSVVETATRTERYEVALVYDPTPIAHREGRGFLYDTKLSGNGLSSCAVCHIDATHDGVAWDLGDPGGQLFNVPSALGGFIAMHPMKGPMSTQTLVGLENHEPFHWRGDRVNFAAFNGAFDFLLGGAQIPPADMAAFSTFIDTVRFGPNPNRNRDDSLPTTPAGLSAADGRLAFQSQPFLGPLRCVDCHALDGGTNDTVFAGSILGETQGFKVAQLRNVYKRDGRKDQGAGVRTSGFGQLHDGTDDDVFDLLSRPVFGPLSTNTTQKTRLMRFVEAFDTGTKPTVGFSRTMSMANVLDAAALADRATLILGATTGHCDLVVRGEIDGEATGLLYDPGTSSFLADRAATGNRSLAALDALLSQDRATLTFVGVPPGQGRRIAIDRDDDGALDGDEAAVAYGSSTAGCALEIRESSPARIGNRAYSVVTDGAQPGAAGVLFLGFGAGSVPLLGVDILIDPTLILTIDGRADAQGQAAFSIAISDNPGLIGVQFFVQSLFLDNCGSFGLAATGGLQVTVEG